MDEKVICDECRGGKSETRGIQRQVLGDWRSRKTCEDDMVGFTIAGSWGGHPGWTLQMGLLSRVQVCRGFAQLESNINVKMQA